MSRQGRDASKDDKPTWPSKRITSLSAGNRSIHYPTPQYQPAQARNMHSSYLLSKWHWFLLTAIIIPQRPQSACGLMPNHYLFIKDMYRASCFWQRNELSCYKYGLKNNSPRSLGVYLIHNHETLLSGLLFHVLFREAELDVRFIPMHLCVLRVME